MPKIEVSQSRRFSIFSQRTTSCATSVETHLDCQLPLRRVKREIFAKRQGSDRRLGCLSSALYEDKTGPASSARLRISFAR